MNRRDFTYQLAGLTLAASAQPLFAAGKTTDSANSSLPFKLSVMLWTVARERSMEDRMTMVADAGYHYVELVQEFAKWTPEDYTRIMAKRRALGLRFDTIALTGSGLADPAGREAFLADVRASLPVVEKLECPSIIVLSGNRVAGLSHEAMHASCVEGLKLAADIVAPHNVTLVLENIDQEENPKYFLTSCVEGLQIVREVNHPNVKFLYDLYHAQIAEGNLIHNLSANLPLIGTIHIADVPGRHEPGTGEINYANIYHQLGRLGFTGTVAMEYLPTSDIVGSLRAAREMVLRAQAGS